ncbi:LOW QUALITY PROTEIN: titin [Vespula maculifrons]|uniref:Titin n=1 Tax=Vespula maculifrons TaxID=7453 RepID=A0ABD2BAR4_VESMC
MGNATTKRHYSKSISLASSSKRPRWDGPGLPAPPGKPILIPGTDDAQPDVVGIRWERSPSNGGSAIVGYLVEHRRMGSAHWVRSKPGLCTFPELTLSGLEPGWRYQFRVRAQNAVGLSAPSELSDPLTVTLQRAAASAPQFDLELDDLIALENEQVSYFVKSTLLWKRNSTNCPMQNNIFLGGILRFTGTPLPKISWFKDGFEIFSSRRTRILTENGKSVLLIHQTALNDEGEIKCTATNRAGHVSTKARLILEAFPKIRLPRQYEDGLLFEQDETIRLKVSLAGRPPPTVAWFHDGEPLSQDTRHIFESMDGESVLKIPDAKRFDRGEYTVKARNKLGEDASSFLVTVGFRRREGLVGLDLLARHFSKSSFRYFVADRPAAPGKVNVTMTLGRSVTLSWKEPEDDGGCKIGTYIVEYYRIGWEVWLKATTSRQTAATLTELLEGSEYRFRVKAENPYGVSDPSEESDIIFIPDLNKGATSPQLTGKSQSQREISRSRGDKREVSFVEPAPRSRSLTREEAGMDGRSRFGGRSSSAQRLSMERPSRADSRVTFGPDTTIHVERTVPPVPPARSRDHSSSRYENRAENHTVRRDASSVKTNELQEGSETEKRDPTSPTVSAAAETKGRPTSPSPKTDPPIGRSSSRSRERSSSPLSLSQTRENSGEGGNGSRSPLLRPISILKKQNGLSDELDATQLAASPRENDDMLHGSSEFMLVLYPKDETENKEDDKGSGSTGSKRGTTEVMEDEEDLVPPPMSLSLPELFSKEHEAIEILREAVSSTEMLHERAMERFYKAMEAEKESESARRKEALERKTGELASIARQDFEMGGALKTVKAPSLRRKLSNSGGATQNLISSWQAKKARRRLSEGQVEGVYKPTKLFSPSLLPDVEARSDPNLPTEEETITARPWRRSSDEEGAERLRRWHETNVPLLEETLVEKSIGLGADDSTNRTISPFREISSEEQERMDERVREEKEEEQVEERAEEEESVETSEESSEEISSADSEDLKNLKQRILARRVMEEEDTYHPRGRPIPHFDSFDKPHFSEYGDPSITDDSTSPSIWVRSPSSPTNLQPKSILKKPKEDGTPRINELGKVVPPEKPIRKVPPVRQEEASDPNGRNLDDTSEYYDSMKPGVMSESDTDSVLSAGEAAKNRRIQAKMRSATPEDETNEADVEARMAVVSHYTEIVREHSSSHNPVAAGRVRDEGSSRGSSSEKDRRSDGPSKNKVSAVTAIKQAGEGEQASAAGEAIGKRKNSVGSRGTTPSREPRLLKERRESRASSRTRSPSSRSRNVSVERGTTASRSSSKTRVRAPSRERNDRPGSRTTSEERALARERSVDRSARNAKGTSRSSSRDRQRATTPAELKIERLQRALESKKYRARNRTRSDIDKYYPESFPTDRASDKRLALQARNAVKSTVNYITDLTLLMAAVYVYLFKKETMAIPFIALLLYRRIQEGIRERISGRWWSSKRKH